MVWRIVSRLYLTAFKTVSADGQCFEEMSCFRPLSATCVHRQCIGISCGGSRASNAIGRSFFVGLRGARSGVSKRSL